MHLLNTEIQFWRVAGEQLLGKGRKGQIAAEHLTHSTTLPSTVFSSNHHAWQEKKTEKPSLILTRLLLNFRLINLKDCDYPLHYSLDRAADSPFTSRMPHFWGFTIRVSYYDEVYSKSEAITWSLIM